MVDLNITDIESIKEKELISLEGEGRAELVEIKGHNCYLVDIKGDFGYSILVFKNSHHIHYTNDYQLHHETIKTKEELRNYYIESLNSKLFTEEELMADVKDYNDYIKKNYYIGNYWIMQFDHVSACYIGNPPEKLVKAKENMFFCVTCFCYVKEKEIVERAYELYHHVKNSFNKIKFNPEVFRNMIGYELANHEACITYNYEEALNSVGLKFENLAEEQQKIVLEELEKQTNYKED